MIFTMMMRLTILRKGIITWHTALYMTRHFLLVIRPTFHRLLPPSSTWHRAIAIFLCTYWLTSCRLRMLKFDGRAAYGRRLILYVGHDRACLMKARRLLADSATHLHERPPPFLSLYKPFLKKLSCCALGSLRTGRSVAAMPPHARPIFDFAGFDDESRECLYRSDGHAGQPPGICFCRRSHFAFDAFIVGLPPRLAFSRIAPRVRLALPMMHLRHFHFCHEIGQPCFSIATTSQRLRLKR